MYRNLKNPASSGIARASNFRRIPKVDCGPTNCGLALVLLKRIRLVFKQVLRFFLKLKFVFKSLLKRRFRARLSVLPLLIAGTKNRGSRMGKGVGKNKVVFWLGRPGNSVFVLKLYSFFFFYFLLKKVRSTIGHFFFVYFSGEKRNFKVQRNF